MLHENIKKEIKQAMLEKNLVKLTVVRGLVSAFTNELVAKRRKPDEWLADDEALAVIKREAKKRQDSIAQFRAGGRADLVAQEEAELKYLEQYLPPMMNREEIKKLALAKKSALGLTDKSAAGKLMSTLMKELKGRADGADVKAVVDETLK